METHPASTQAQEPLETEERKYGWESLGPEGRNPGGILLLVSWVALSLSQPTLDLAFSI